MNEPHPTPGLAPTDHTHEPRDINARIVGLTALGLLLALVISLAVVRWMFHLFAVEERRAEPLPPPLFQANRLPPAPRLQANPSRDLQEMRAMEDQVLHGYRWIDTNAGIARIPIDRAMELLVRKQGGGP